MSVLPRFPWPQSTTHKHHEHYAERDGENDFDAGEAHEAEITTGGKVCVAREELVRLILVVECEDATNSVVTRDNANDQRR